MMRTLAAPLTALALLSAPSLAQESSDTQRVIEAIFGAINLPQVAEEAIDEGVSESGLGEVLEEMRRRSLPAEEAEDVLDQEIEALRAGGPVGNFGAFVQSRLESGLRGRALAEAIRAEHRRMGVGMPEQRAARSRVPGGRGQGTRGPRGQGPDTPDGARGRGRGGDQDGRAGRGPGGVE